MRVDITQHNKLCLPIMWANTLLPHVAMLSENMSNAPNTEKYEMWDLLHVTPHFEMVRGKKFITNSSSCPHVTLSLTFQHMLDLWHIKLQLPPHPTPHTSQLRGVHVPRAQSYFADYKSVLESFGHWAKGVLYNNILCNAPISQWNALLITAKT